MVFILLMFQFILIVITFLTTCMIKHKFTSIRASLDMYGNKRVYKTKAHIEFIENIIKEYQRLSHETDEQLDLYSMIHLKLHKEYIGRFTYVGIKNMAIKARHLMWGILGVQVIVAYINQIIYSTQAIIMLMISFAATIIMCFYGIIKGVAENEEMLIDEVSYYISTVYPIECKVQAEKNNTAFIVNQKRGSLTEKTQEIGQTNQALSSNVPNIEMKERNRKKTNKNTDYGLSARDIAKMLSDL